MDAANDNELPRTRAEAKATGSTRYFTGKPCIRGHVAQRYTNDGGCIACSLEDSSRWKKQNKEKVKDTISKWRDANHDYVLQYSRDYRSNNKEQVQAATRRWREENPEKVKEYTAQYAARMASEISESRKRQYEKKQGTAKGRLENAISTGVHNGLIKGSKAGRKTFDILGYSVDDLRRHLEKQFQPGMTWENYGIGGWEIDHIIPRSAFNFETPDDVDFKRCWALSNLQPLWASDNRSKNAKLDKPFQPSLLLATNDNRTPRKKETKLG